MHVPPAFQRSDDIALLCELADPESDATPPADGDPDRPADGGGSAGDGAAATGAAVGGAAGSGAAGGDGLGTGVVGGDAAGGSGDVVLLDGQRLGYLVVRGRVDIVAVRRQLGGSDRDRGRRLATLQQGAVMPSSTVLGAWQLVLVPAPGSRLRPLSTGRLRAIGYGVASAPPSGLIPTPRVVSVIVAALARGLDAALLTLADALRTGDPPSHSVPIRPGQFVSLDAGAAVTADGGACWLRVAGGHARRNGEDATVFGGAEPALLVGQDWIAVDGPATAEATTTADLLATGHLPAAMDQHMVLTLRSIDRRLAREG